MKKSTSFYSAATLLLVLNLIIKPIWIFGIDRMVQNEVGVSEYGSYFALFNLSVVLNFALDIGLTNYSNRELAASNSVLSEQLGKLLSLKILFACVYLLILFFVAWLTDTSQWELLIKLAFLQIASSMFMFFRSIITANQWFTTDAVLSIIDKSLIILLFGSFLSFSFLHQFVTIESFVNWQLAAMLSAMTVAAIILKVRNIRFQHGKQQFAFRSILPYALLIFLMSAHSRLDAFLLEQLHWNGATEAGFYASAFRLLDASNMIIILFCSFLLPFIARQWNMNQFISEIVLQSRNLLLFYAITLSVIAIFSAEWIQELLYHHRSHSSLIAWTLPTLIGYALTGIYGTVLTSVGEIKMFTLVVLTGLVINLVLNLLLIPKFGAFGCAWSALISQSVTGITLLISCSRKLKIAFDFKAITIYLATSLLLLVLFIVLQNIAPVPVTILITLLLSLTIAISTKIILPNKWLNFLQTNK